MDHHKLAKLIDETIDSMDAAERATPSPFLLTRLNAALRMDKISYWERVTVFLGRPAVAIAAVLLVLVLNFLMYTYSNANQGSFQTTGTGADEYSMINPAALFDIENTQP